MLTGAFPDIDTDIQKEVQWCIEEWEKNALLKRAPVESKLSHSSYI